MSENRTTILIRNATVVVTMDAQRREIPDGAVVVTGNAIRWVGPTSEMPAELADAI